MKKNMLFIDLIPAIIWGKQSKKVIIYIHGKNGYKEEAILLAKIAEEKGYQTISFDLPEHGERQNKSYSCNVWNSVRDLEIIWKYVYKKWNIFSLYACSIGAYFGLHAYKNICFEKVLFLSPIVDMEYLIKNMFLWFDVSEAELKKQNKIVTPIETLSWDYYQFVKNNPIEKWNSPTYLLYGNKDTLQSTEIVHNFTRKFQCLLTESKDSEHSFLNSSDRKILSNWIKRNL